MFNLKMRDFSSMNLAVSVLFLSGTLLSAGIFMEHAMSLEPCALCMMQRFWLFACALVAFVGIMHNPNWGIYPLLTAACAIVGTGFSLRQLWLQTLPADQVPACGPGFTYMAENFPVWDLIVAMTSGSGNCAEVSWSFIGLSIPAWLSVFFAVIIVVSALQIRRGLV